MVLETDLDPVRPPPPWVALLPALDPTPMGWYGRDWYLEPGHRAALFDRTGNVGPDHLVGRTDRRRLGPTRRRSVASRSLEDIGKERTADVQAEVDRLDSLDRRRAGRARSSGHRWSGTWRRPDRARWCDERGGERHRSGCSAAHVPVGDESIVAGSGVPALVRAAIATSVVMPAVGTEPDVVPTRAVRRADAGRAGAVPDGRRGIWPPACRARTSAHSGRRTSGSTPSTAPDVTAWCSAAWTPPGWQSCSERGCARSAVPVRPDARVPTLRSGLASVRLGHALQMAGSGGSRQPGRRPRGTGAAAG